MKNGNNLSEPIKLPALESQAEDNRGLGARRDAEPLLMRSDSSGNKRTGRGRMLLLLVLVVLLACGAGYWWREREKAAATPATAPNAQSAAKSASDTPSSAEIAKNSSLDGALGLALQGISLFSGEKGAELWRLKASFAHLIREGDNIDVDEPVVRYTMGNPGDPDFQTDFLDVKADKGRVTDNQRHITLWDNVDVRRFNEVMTGPRLDYDSQTRTMVFPEGATLDGPKASGEAALLTWDLGNNVLIAENNVIVIIKPAPDEPDASGKTQNVEGQTVSDEVIVAPAASVIQKTTTPAAKKIPVRSVIKKSTAKSKVQKQPAKSSPKKSSTPQKSSVSSTKTPAKTSSKQSPTQSAPTKR